MNRHSKISIVLCTYNGEKFLHAQLESIRKQSRQPDEIVVNDDISNDHTVKIIENFAKTVSFPVRLEVNERNLGSTKNFEKAIWRATGDIIFLCDQDDIWASHKIERIEEVFKSDNSIGLVFSNAILIDENDKPIGRKLWDYTFPQQQRKKNMLEVLLWQNVVTGATAAFRSEFRELFSPIPTNIPNMIHDDWIALTISAAAKVVALDENLIFYRQHPEQQLGVIRNYNQKSRKSKSYEEDINFRLEEIKRLESLPSILRNYDVFYNYPMIQGTIESYIKEKQEVIEHLQARMNLPKARFRRLMPIWQELLTGRYHRFSRGLLSAIKDLLLKEIN
jgi:glycosyltransferase involved in cell wall biosynthesis